MSKLANLIFGILFLCLIIVGIGCFMYGLYADTFFDLCVGIIGVLIIVLLNNKEAKK